MKTVILDFDGVIHSYSSGWQGCGNIPDPIVPGIDIAIEELRDAGYKVIVCSSRCHGNDGVGAVAIREYLAENSIMVDGVTSEKVPAVAIVDDRAIKFEGNSTGLLQRVNSIVSWTQDIESGVVKDNVSCDDCERIKSMEASYHNVCDENKWLLEKLATSIPLSDLKGIRQHYMEARSSTEDLGGVDARLDLIENLIDGIEKGDSVGGK